MAENSTISGAEICKYLKLINKAKFKAGEITGELGDQLKQARDNAGLHIRAAKDTARLARMDELTRDDYLDKLHQYIKDAEDGGLFSQHAADIADLAVGKPAKKKVSERVKENISQLKKGIKKLQPADLPGDEPLN